ncbi:MAG: alpha/beta hydrolase [Phycisphaeraceae bacterium]|nr:MAG: alpha/beta hydrolase [Phycisphaeraceae bacterium]
MHQLNIAALVVASLLFLLIGVSSAATRAPADTAAAERWAGVIELPGLELEFSVTFTDDGGASIDIPLQGVAGLALEDVAREPERLAFTLAPQGSPAVAVFQLERESGAAEAVGTISQAGQTFPVRMRRLEADGEVGPRRPQHPKRPFPYEEREVEIENAAGGVTLAGTLTIPDSRGPHPAVIFITGSGPQDRDETLFGHKPFLVISDHLTRRGVATLRLDDRGVGGSTGSVMNSTSEDFVSDVLAAVDFLKATPGINSGRIGLIGHSEGAIVAPMAATERPDDIAFIVLLAGTGLPGGEILVMQLQDILRASGVSEESIERQIAHQRRMLGHLAAGEDAAATEALRELIKEQAGPGATDAQIDEVLENNLAQINSPWFRSFIPLDPREFLKQTRCPVLALCGSLDLQVPAEANLTAIRTALREAGNQDVTILELEGLNHLFQTARTGLPGEYGSIEETFAPQALDIVAEWVEEQSR